MNLRWIPIGCLALALSCVRATQPPDCDGTEDSHCSDVMRRAIYQELLDAAAARVLLEAPRAPRANRWPDWAAAPERPRCASQATRSA